MELVFETTVPAPREEVFAFHADPRNLDLLMDGWSGYRLLGHDGNVRPGSTTWVRQRVAFVLPFVLGMRHHLYDPPRRFGESRIHGPFTRFDHLHEFEEAEGGTLVRDRLHLRLAPLLGGEIWLKAEFLNPGGSIKDRMVRYILARAKEKGELAGGLVVENTSGNTGFAVAMICAHYGLRCILTLPDKMSAEKIHMLKGMGAEVVVTPTNVPADSPESYYETARRIHRNHPGSYYLNQYHNPLNIESHYADTGPEIWEQTDGEFDAFVAGLGTGGTMSGAGKYFKERKPAVLNVGVDPRGSVYHEYFRSGKLPTPRVYKVEGIGEDMLCKAMDFSVLDRIEQVDDRESFLMTRRLAREEGLFAGGSTGSAVVVAARLAAELGPGRKVVVIAPDSGSRYITKCYSDEWMKDSGFLAPARTQGSLRDLLSRKPKAIYACRPGEAIQSAVSRMKEFAVSQMPALGDDGRILGMLHEVDLLEAVVYGHRRIEDPIDAVIKPVEGVVGIDTELDALHPIFDADDVAMVKDGDSLIGIVTKMDLIDYMAQGQRAERAKG